MKRQIAWIQEKTKEEVEAVRDKLLQSEKIKSAGEIEKQANQYIIINANARKHRR